MTEELQNGEKTKWAIRLAQIDRLRHLGFHTEIEYPTAVEMPYEVYQTSFPAYGYVNPEVERKYPITLFVDPRVDLATQLRLMRIHNGLDKPDEPDHPFKVTVDDVKQIRPSKPYQIWVQPGGKYRGYSFEDLQEAMREQGERGLTAFEALALVREHPEFRSLMYLAGTDARNGHVLSIGYEQYDMVNDQTPQGRFYLDRFSRDFTGDSVTWPTCAVLE